MGQLGLWMGPAVAQWLARGKPPHPGHQLTEILPDFVQGWFLLNDAGLTPSERNLVHTAVHGEYSVQRIAQELRNQWDEQSLRRRESSARTQSGFLGDEADEIEVPDEPVEMGCALEELTAEGLALVAAAEDQVNEAMAAIEKGKRTLTQTPGGIQNLEPPFCIDLEPLLFSWTRPAQLDPPQCFLVGSTTLFRVVES